MNQQLWSGLTAALIITSLGVTAPSSQADQPRSANEGPGSNTALDESSATEVSAEALQARASSAQTGDVVKVGEYQSQQQVEEAEEAIANIQSHDMDGRQAATLYVRNIPVITFLGSDDTAASVPETSNTASSRQAMHVDGDTDVKVAAAQTNAASVATAPAATESEEDYRSDPVWRATAIAARLNQLHRDSVDAESITVSWDAEQERYVIKVDGAELVEINGDTILPDTTSNEAEDALQVANRLRRQLGNAPPLRDIEGRPQPRSQQVAFGPVRFQISGLASWYGPGFHGNRSASGEIFNQNALTAAHPSLPFGTQVRVTNVNNGQSVVVRINDRGPYSGRRVIDLSAAAARAVGLIQSGVAPVRIDVLGAAQPARSN